MPDFDTALKDGSLARDPYPHLAQLRLDAPVAHIPAMGRWLVTSHALGAEVLTDASRFGSARMGKVQTEVFGLNMQYIDGNALRARRMAAAQGLKPATIQSHWVPLLRAIARDRLQGYLAKGQGDLMADIIAPMSGENLRHIMGMTETAPETIGRWSNDLIDAIEEGSEAAIARGRTTGAEIDAALEEAFARRKARPDESMISHLITSGQAQSAADIAGDIKLTIGGGFNEPMNSVATALVGLARNPDQWRLVKEDPGLLPRVFDEAVRWVAPIGLTGRSTRGDQRLGEVDLPDGTPIMVSLAAMNRDPAVFAQPDAFDIGPDRPPHAAFGSGGHRCLGATLAKQFSAGILLPMLVAGMTDLSLTEDPEFRGFSFRGPTHVAAAWSPA